MKKILLIRFSSIGDIVLTTPVVRALKKQLDCQLHVLTKKQYAGIYQHNPHVDKVHYFEKELSEVYPDLKKQQFDFVVDLQKNLRSLKVRRALKQPSASFPKLNKQKWLLVNFKINKLPGVHIVDRYFEAVKSFGVTNDNKGLDYFIPDEAHVNPYEIDPRFDKEFIAFAIGGQHFTKMMPAGKVASLVSRINFPVVLLGGKEDAEKGVEIKKLSHNAIILNAAGKLSLDQSASMIRQAAVVLTNDTGLMHIAAAFHKKIVSFWGNTVPAFGMSPYFPGFGERSHISEVPGLRCRPCSKLGYKKCPKKHFKCMTEQDEDLIVQKTLALIGE
ncbi:MAG: glycosyltransferase family 9 protein [Bacteroidales bacterium]|nr:glycosyltransferase family 9 protein [Bacteroidales bacterium]